MSDPQRSGRSTVAELLDEACQGLPSHFRELMGRTNALLSDLPEAGRLEVSLLDAGLRELHEALALDPSDREGAFSLLAADALLTLACERWALEEDGDERLYQTIRRISGRLT
ncbi:MAG: hypothetical protein WEA09_01945 [Gemmatimonadota bacterium]